ncbi:LysM peptidoglycan-binding domain-containing C40 family peptidase [Lactiplantibacillus sp. DA1]|uniref:C40 family peptidase n=1 Tax=Lactiplantibacillus sp. DA1 TaxID=3079857 RepID=UPI00292A648C|nr:LysM peptidoglycan-binding domain-containing C40 family peptidase [Lactiplantibacillus sp. DA1]MDV0431004.1 LysM peptidoglycan-binding domain-containing C40 family peptidase [Lactiplantibacillus sp. DA1]
MKVNIKQVMLGTAALAGMLVTSQAVANADSMTIKAGDTVWAYAQKYNVSVDKIAEANGLSNPNMIIAGKTINIPGVKTGEKVTTKTTTASASSTKSTSAATSTSSQAASSTTSAAATSSSTTSASSTSQAVSSSSVAAQSNSTSTASASSVTSSASTSSVASQASSSAVTSSATSQSSASQSSASQSSTSVASSTSTTATSTQSAATSTSSQASSTASNSTSNNSSTGVKAVSYSASTTTASYGSVIAAAKTFIGTPYEQMDCSAFTQAAFAKIGRSIGRTTYAQATIGTHVSFSQAQAGDLVFWGSDSAPYHVGIYLGGGQYIASPTYGESVSIKSTAYYTPSFAIHM